MELTSPPQENVNVSVPSGPYLPYAPTRSGLSTDSATPVAPVTFHEMITGTAGARNTAVPSGHLGCCVTLKYTMRGPVCGDAELDVRGLGLALLWPVPPPVPVAVPTPTLAETLGDGVVVDPVAPEVCIGWQPTSAASAAVPIPMTRKRGETAMPATVGAPRAARILNSCQPTGYGAGIGECRTTPASYARCRNLGVSLDALRLSAPARTPSSTTPRSTRAGRRRPGSTRGRC